MQRKTKVKSEKAQRLDAELGLIVDEMGRAMWNADKTYIATSMGHISAGGVCPTTNMQLALAKFKDYCERHHGKKETKNEKS
jgi:glycine cleavage system aminomethyltransferase T